MRANRKLRKKSQSQRNRRLFLKEFAIAAQSQMILRLAIAAQTQSVFTKNLHPCAVLKQERFEIDLHLKSRERNLLEATREIAELERLLQTSNSSITRSLSTLSTEL
jgi:hypothetical protein